LPAQPSLTTTKTASDEKTIADILLKNKALTQEQYQKVKLEHINTGRPVEEIIFEKNFVSEKEMARAKGEVYGVPFVNLAETSISPQAINLVPETVAQRFICFPFALDGQKKVLSLAMANPRDLSAIEFIQRKTGYKIAPFIAPASLIKEFIETQYAQSLPAEVTEALKETGYTPGSPPVIEAEKIGEIIKEAPIAKIVSTLLEFAVKARASDIHIEPQEARVRVRYRIDGILHEKLILPRNVHEAVVSRIKILCGMKIDEKRLPQDGRFTFKVDNEEVDLRVSSLPSVHGEKIVMRLLKKSGKVPELPELGLRGRALKNLQEAIRVPHGIILVTGPTGSGKTTTLYSVLSKINTMKVNVITVEDPVEYEIAGVNQVQVNPQAGLTFASGMRSLLRQDPDIIMVGEIRDEETTNLAVQASLTGHLVFSTLHTNSASGALPRLLDLKAEPFLLASSMTSVVGQRVVRRICEACKEEYQPSSEVIADIKNVLGSLFAPYEGKPFKLYRGRKCEKCNETGYFGRIGIFEVLPVGEKIAKLILERAPANKIEAQAVADGMITMKQDGYLKALEGATTIEEVLRVAEVSA